MVWGVAIDLNAALVQDKALGALNQFCHWLKGEAASDEIEAFYLDVGRRRNESIEIISFPKRTSYRISF